MITYFHRRLDRGPSINKVTQTIISEIPDKREYYVPYSGASLKDILGNIKFIFKNRDKKGVNHITGDIHYGILALIGCKSVLTIHDTVLVDFRITKGLKRIVAILLWFSLPLHFATKVVCISDATKHKVQRFTHRKDIYVIHNAIDPLFHPLIKPFSANKPTILIVGTNPNKNIERTITALQGLSCHLTIIGNLTSNQIELLNENGIEYANKNQLSDSQIVEEYEKADIVSFVSLFEGFGMIIIEANMIGRPVISSKIDVLKEIGADSVLYVDPEDVNSIRGGFTSLFNNEVLRCELVQKGFENVKRFDDKTIRRQWQSLYASLQ